MTTSLADAITAKIDAAFESIAQADPVSNPDIVDDTADDLLADVGKLLTDAGVDSATQGKILGALGQAFNVAGPFFKGGYPAKAFKESMVDSVAGMSKLDLISGVQATTAQSTTDSTGSTGSTGADAGSTGTDSDTGSNNQVDNGSGTVDLTTNVDGAPSIQFSPPGGGNIPTAADNGDGAAAGSGTAGGIGGGINNRNSGPLLSARAVAPAVEVESGENNSGPPGINSPLGSPNDNNNGESQGSGAEKSDDGFIDKMTQLALTSYAVAGDPVQRRNGSNESDSGSDGPAEDGSQADQMGGEAVGTAGALGGASVTGGAAAAAGGGDSGTMQGVSATTAAVVGGAAVAGGVVVENNSEENPVAGLGSPSEESGQSGRQVVDTTISRGTAVIFDLPRDGGGTGGNQGNTENIQNAENALDGVLEISDNHNTSNIFSDGINANGGETGTNSAGADSATNALQNSNAGKANAAASAENAREASVLSVGDGSSATNTGQSNQAMAEQVFQEATPMTAPSNPTGSGDGDTLVSRSNSHSNTQPESKPVYTIDSKLGFNPFNFMYATTIAAANDDDNNNEGYLTEKLSAFSSGATKTYAKDQAPQNTNGSESGNDSIKAPSNPSPPQWTTLPTKTNSDSSTPGTTFSIENSRETRYVDEGEAVTITILRSGDVSGQDSVVLKTYDDSAVAGQDFPSSIDGTRLIFRAGVTSMPYPVDTYDDQLYEVSSGLMEGFYFGLAGPSSGAAVKDEKVIIAIDDDDPAPEFSVASATATEGNGLLFTISRSGNSTGSHTVYYRFTDGSATKGADYTATTDRVTFASDEYSRLVTVTTADDTSDESDETFTISLYYASGGGTFDSARTTATGTIVDNDAPPTPGLSVSDASAQEGANLVFTIARSGDTSGSQSVDFAFTDGSAGANDYAYTGDTNSVAFAADETEKKVTVATSGDSLYEGDQTFTVSLSNATNGATITTATATGTITDDETAPGLGISAVTAAEGNDLVFTVRRTTGEVENDQTVDYTFTDGTATSADYTGTAGTVTFANGETSQLITVATEDDTLYEGDQTFTVSLANATNGASIYTARATGTISDNETEPVFTLSNATATEGDPLLITFTWDVPFEGDAVTEVLYNNTATSLGLAKFNDDFSGFQDVGNALGPVLDFSYDPGGAGVTITINTVQDTLYEGDERLYLYYSNQGNFSNPSIRVSSTIIDDDPVPTFSIADVSATEGSDLVFTIARSGDAEGPQTVDYAFTDGTATSADYTDIGDTGTDGTVTFTTGETTQLLTVATTGDTLYEGDETFTVSLSNPTGGATIITAEATGTITDDDAVPEFSITDASATEGSDLVFTISRSGDTSGSQTVDYAFADGTAISADYTGTAGTATFASGDTSQLITVATGDDTLYEGDQTFTVSLSNATGDATITTATATGTITDNETAPGLSIAAVTAAEGNDLVFTVSRTSGDVENDQTVDYTFTDNTATSADYTGAAGTVTFANGETTQLITVATSDDTLYEGDQTFTVSLANATNGATITTAEATGAITDDETAPGLSIAAATAAEGSNLVFTVSRTSGDVENDQTVDYTTSDGTATSSDYTGTTGTVTFANGDTSQLITVSTSDDSLYEGDQTFTVSLANATNGASITTATATGTITDDETAPGLSIAAVTATEGNDLVFTVSRTSGDVESAQTVDYAFTDGTATSADYTGTDGTVTFANGETSQLITVTTGDGTLYEGDQTFTVSLANATGGATISTAQATGTITDNETAPTFALSTASGTVQEGGAFTFTIGIDSGSADANTAHTLTYATSDGTASSAGNADYTAANASVTFAAGESADQTLTIATTDDADNENAETFNISLSGGSGTNVDSTALQATIAASDQGLSAFTITHGADGSGQTLSFTSGTSTLHVTGIPTNPFTLVGFGDDDLISIDVMEIDELKAPPSFDWWNTDASDELGPFTVGNYVQFKNRYTTSGYSTETAYILRLSNTNKTMLSIQSATANWAQLVKFSTAVSAALLATSQIDLY